MPNEIEKACHTIRESHEGLILRVTSGGLKNEEWPIMLARLALNSEEAEVVKSM